MIVRVAKDSLYVHREWNPDRRKTCVDLARYFCVAKLLLLSMASDKHRRLDSTCFLCTVPFLRFTRIGLLQVSAHAIPASLQLGTSRFQRHPQRSTVFPFPRLALPTLSKLDQLMRTRIALHDDRHRFGRQSDRFMSRAL